MTPFEYLYYHFYPLPLNQNHKNLFKRPEFNGYKT